MTGVALWAVLSVIAAPAVDVATPTVLVLEFKADVDDNKLAHALSQQAVLALTGRSDVHVTSYAELKSAMDFEGERATAGCDSAACAAELAGALGADEVVFGDVTRIDKLLVVGISRYDAHSGKTLGREVVRAPSSALALERTTDAVQRLFAGQASVNPAMVIGAAVVGAGVVGALVGGGIVALATETLRSRTSSGADKDAAFVAVPIGWIVVGVSIVAVAVGAATTVVTYVVE